MAKQDFGKLDKLIKRVAQAAAGRTVKKAAAAMGRVTLDLSKQGAEAAKNPQGRPWKKLKKGGGPALRWIAGSLSMTLQGTRVVIVSSNRIAGFHQRGAKAKRRSGPLPPKGLKSKSHLSLSKWKLPRRAILPKASLPKPWKEPVYRAAREAVGTELGSR